MMNEKAARAAMVALAGVRAVVGLLARDVATVARRAGKATAVRRAGMATADRHAGMATAARHAGTETAVRRAGTETAVRHAGTETAARRAGTETAARRAGTETAARRAGMETAVRRAGTALTPVFRAGIVTMRTGVVETISTRTGTAVRAATTARMTGRKSAAVTPRSPYAPADASPRASRTRCTGFMVGTPCSPPWPIHAARSSA